MARAIAGLFPDRMSAERAIEDLKSAGIDPNRIGVVMQDKKETQAVTEEHGTHSTESAIGGSIIGGTAGALLAATGALVIPGIGPFVSAGILATSLVGGAAGWLVGGLVGLGIPKEEAQYYEDRVHGGSALVTVDAQGAQGREAEVRQIMLRDGAEDLQDRGYGGGYDQTATVAAAPQQQYVQTAQPAQQVQTQTQSGDLRIPVVEEELTVGKRQEEQGRVRIHKEIVTEQQNVPVTLRHEEVVVERVPVTGQGTADLTDAFQGQDIVVPVMGEEAVVAKQAHQVEEVRLRKEAVTENQQVSDTVRKERVIVDGVEDQGTTGTNLGTTRR